MYLQTFELLFFVVVVVIVCFTSHCYSALVFQRKAQIKPAQYRRLVNTATFSGAEVVQAALTGFTCTTSAPPPRPVLSLNVTCGFLSDHSWRQFCLTFITT